MADTLVQRVTGLPDPAQVPVEIHVVVTDRALFEPTTTHDATTHAHRTPAQPTNTRPNTPTTDARPAGGQPDACLLYTSRCV